MAYGILILLTRNWTQGPGSESAESSPLDRQEISKPCYGEEEKQKCGGILEQYFMFCSLLYPELTKVPSVWVDI